MFPREVNVCLQKRKKEPKGSFFLTALFFLSVTENTDCGREDREAFIEYGTDVEVDGGIHRHQCAGEEDAVSKSLRRKKAERDGVDGECYDDQKIGGTLPEKDAYRTHGESEEGAREIAEAPRLGLKIIA